VRKFWEDFSIDYMISIETEKFSNPQKAQKLIFWDLNQIFFFFFKKLQDQKNQRLFEILKINSL